MSEVTDPYVPMPMTCHPVFEGQAEAIRSGIDSGRYALEWIAPRRIDAHYSSWDDDKAVTNVDLPIVRLDIKKCVGPAPFVGDPIWQDGWYTWRVAIDPSGRHVAADATLSISERVTPRR